MSSNNGLGGVDPTEEIIDKVFLAAGYTKTESDGTTVRDDDKMKARAFDVVKEHVVTGSRQKSAGSITQGELYAAVFPGGPGVKDSERLEDLSPEAYEARKKLVRRVWNLTNPGRQGYIQKRLGDSTKLVLCRAAVMRELDEVKGCYVTENPDLIITDSLRPQIEAMVRQATNLAHHFDMLNARHPELSARMLGELGTGMNRAAAALPEATGGASTRGRKEKTSEA